MKKHCCLRIAILLCLSFGSKSLGAPGTSTLEGFTLSAAGIYEFELNSANATPGNGADFLNITGVLDVAAGNAPGSRFTIGVVSLDSSNANVALSDFSSGNAYRFTLATAGGGITGFSADEFAFDTGGFKNALNGGSFSAAQNGNNLVLQFNPAANPGAELYWDSNFAVAGSDSTDGSFSQNKWTVDVSGLSATGVYIAGSRPTFAAGSNGTGTYTVSVDQAVQAQGLSVEEGNVTLSAGGGTLTLNSAEVSVATNAAAVIAAPVAGTIGLTKIGVGTLTLTGANTYSGATTVNAGTLALQGAGSDQALPSPSPIAVTNGGTLLLGGSNQINNQAAMTLGGGNGVSTFNAGGNSEILGTLTLSSNSVLDLADRSSVQFANSSNQPWTGTLSVYNWSGNLPGSGDLLIFGNDASGLTNTQLSQIIFYSGSGTGSFGPGAQILADGQITPVPEPATIFGGLALVGLICYRERHRFRLLLRCA